jgi:hypothetical protein
MRPAEARPVHPIPVQQAIALAVAQSLIIPYLLEVWLVRFGVFYSQSQYSPLVLMQADARL